MKLLQPSLLLLFLLGQVVGQNEPEITEVPAGAPGDPTAETPFPTTTEVLKEEEAAEAAATEIPPEGGDIETKPVEEPSIEVENDPLAFSQNETSSATESPPDESALEEKPETNEIAPETAPPSSGGSEEGTAPGSTNSESESGPEGEEVPEGEISQPEIPESPPTEPTEIEPTDTLGEGGTDDYGEGPEEGEYEGEGEWGGEEEEEERTKAPYVPPTGDDPFAKPPDESEWKGEDWPQETPEQMMHDKNVIIAVSSAVLFGIVLAIFSAQQVIENPDGCCAGICRCFVKIFCCFFKILFFPCRMCCGNKDRRSHDLMIGESNSYTHDLELT